MKKILIFTLVVSCLCLLTGCGKNKENSKDSSSEEEYSVYEMHAYDADFKHTEEIVVKYKEDGTIKYAEYYLLWDMERDCEHGLEDFNESEDAKYPDVKFVCNTEDGKTLAKWSMTDKSLESGYLTDDKDFRGRLKYMYDDIKDEASLKKMLEEEIESLRERNMFDERTYFVIDGKRIDS